MYLHMYVYFCFTYVSVAWHFPVYL